MGLKTALLCAAAICAPLAAQAQDNDQRLPPLYKPSVSRGADPAVANRDPNLPVTNVNEAIALAYWTNPVLLSQRALLRSTDARYPEVRSAYGPQLTAQATHVYTRSRVESLGTVFPFDGFSSAATAILSVPLFTFGRNSVAEDDALARVAFGREQLRLTEADVMERVLTTYASIRRDNEALAIARQNYDLLQRQYNDESERFRVREITSTDLQQVETRLELGLVQVLNAQAQLGTSRSGFVQNVGALPGNLAPPPPLQLGVNTLDEAYAIAETNSALIRAAQSREKVSRAALSAARKEQLPTVAARGTASTSTVDPYNNSVRRSDVTGGVVVSVPLIDSGGRRARIEQASEANQSDWRLIDSAVRETRQNVASAWDDHRAAQESLAHFRLAVVAAQKAYDGALVQEKAGARTTLDVLDLARDLLNVQTSYATATANEYIARVRLLSAMGKLEAPNLVPNITAYDPGENFRRVQKRGDVPLLTPFLSALDSLANRRDANTDRAIRDPYGQVRAPSQLPSPGK